MATIKLNRPLLILALVGIILYGFVAWAASATSKDNPEFAAVDTPLLSKAGAIESAVPFLREHAGISGSYEAYTTYQSHKTFSGYLQKEKLYDTYEKQYIRKYPIDYFQVEVADRQSGARYIAEVDFIDGHVVGWSKETKPVDKRASVDGADKQQIAAKAISAYGYDETQFRFVRQSASGGAYIFESDSMAIGESKLQLHITVQDGQIAAFEPRFSVPASYEAWQTKQDESAALMTWFSLGVTLLMTFAALTVIVKYRAYISFRQGVLLTMIYMALYGWQNMNMYPTFKTVYNEAGSGWAALSPLFFMNFIVFVMAGSLYVSLLAGREMWLSRGWNAWPSYREPGFDREVMNGMGRGYLLCLFILGIQQVLFYAAETYFDVWAVNDPGDSVYNMIAPATFPLMAWVAAISEEATYRLFGIALFARLLRNRFLAVLVPSMIWALSHTQYPIYPVYTRFVEVTVIGIIFGYAFLKYGFITVVFAHASMDSLLMGLSLTTTGSAANTAIGIVYVFAPAIVAVVIARYWRNRSKQGPPPFPPRPERPPLLHPHEARE